MKTFTTVALAATLALAAPAFAAETPTPTTTPSAQEQCRTERAGMGKATFAQTYGTNANRSNAFGKCVSKRAAATERAGRQARANAAEDCRAERTADAAAFQAKYGTGKRGSNAYGKCVSQKARADKAAKVRDEVEANVSAAKSCKTERAAGREAFEQKYGTNRNRRNAFGKCVSQKAKAQQDAAPAAAPQS